MHQGWQRVYQVVNTRNARRFAHTLTGDDYQFLHKSVIPSYHFQKSLRRLPIPKLADSCNRYLASAKVVLSSEQYAEAERLIRDFEKTDGPGLQQALLAYDKAHKDSSYISEPWFDIYLRARVPIAVNYNPFMMYAPDPQSQYMTQAVRATNFVVSYARFKKALDANVLAPEVFHLNAAKSDTKAFRTVCKSLPSSLSWFGAVAFKAFPLDMSQYKSLFNGTRIPKKDKDVLYNDPTAQHFVAIHKGRFYSVRLFNDKGLIVPAEEVLASISFILKQSGSGEGVGSLTSLDRNEWAEVRAQLESEGNGATLRAIDGALFALCLDDLKSEDPQRLVKSLLIGDDASNRWFDKCFQLIVDGNGQATLNFEHSWGDGVAVLRLMEESFRDTNKHHFVGPSDPVSSVVDGAVKELKWSVSSDVRARVSEAQKKHITANDVLDFATVQYTAMTRDSIKKYKLSPDALMQLAIQVAFHSRYGEFVPTYESCSTAAFLKGRTECMRSATAATRAATLAISENKSVKDIIPLINNCSAQHGQLVKEASMGQGFDRHLLGLRITADRLGKQPHEFFSSAAHSRMGHFVISTSTLSTETLVFGGFGPVVPDGLGIGYNVVSSMLGAVVTSNKKHRSASEFSESMHTALDKLRWILDQK